VRDIEPLSKKDIMRRTPLSSAKLPTPTLRLDDAKPPNRSQEEALFCQRKASRPSHPAIWSVNPGTGPSQSFGLLIPNYTPSDARLAALQMGLIQIQSSYEVFHRFPDFLHELREAIWKDEYWLPRMIEIHPVVQLITCVHLGLHPRRYHRSRTGPRPLIFACRDSHRIALRLLGKPAVDHSLITKSVYLEHQKTTLSIIKETLKHSFQSSGDLRLLPIRAQNVPACEGERYQDEYPRNKQQYSIFINYQLHSQPLKIIYKKISKISLDITSGYLHPYITIVKSVSILEQENQSNDTKPASVSRFKRRSGTVRGRQCGPVLVADGIMKVSIPADVAVRMIAVSETHRSSGGDYNRIGHKPLSN
jgi:hypothetical protein